MRLDAVHRKDHVGGRRMAVEVEADRADLVVLRGGHDGGLHARPDLGADPILGDAEASQRGELTIGGRTAVAAHCRHDERQRAQVAQPCDRAPQHLDAPGQATAARADGDGRARTELQSSDDRRPGGRLDVADRGSAGRRQLDLGQRRNVDVIERQCDAGCELLPTDRHTVDLDRVVRKRSAGSARRALQRLRRPHAIGPRAPFGSSARTATMRR